MAALGSIFENLNLESSREYLPSSVSKLINTNYYSKDTFFTPQEIVTGLNSGNDSAIYIVLKFLVRILTTERKYAEVNSAFPHVIKNINSSNLRIRRLVYYILLRFSQEQPDISLLSINAIQKSLQEHDCISRALAIRALAGIRVSAILPILSLSLKKTVKDSSPLVRSASAIAAIKCHQLDRLYNEATYADQDMAARLSDTSSVTSQLYQLIDTLLADNDSRVVGSAILAYHAVFPGCFDLIHGKVSHLISKLNYMDNYSTALLIDILTDYCKLFFLPTETFTEEAQYPEAIRDLLTNLRFLVYNDSCDVILSLTRCAVALFPTQIVSLQLPKVLLRWLHGSTKPALSDSHIQELVLSEIYHMLGKSLVEFSSHQTNNFVPLSTDSYNVSKLKIQILFRLINNDTFDYIFDELRFIVEDSARPLPLRKFTLRQLNSVLVSDLSATQLSKAVRFFMAQLQSSGPLISEYITGLRQLIQSNVVGYVDVLIKLAGKLLVIDESEDTLAPVAQATIVWLLGEFAITAPKIHAEDLQLEGLDSDKTKVAALQDYLPDVFRILIGQFKDLDTIVKLEILQALAKLVTNQVYTAKNTGQVYVLERNTVFKLFNYVLQLTKYDHNTDLRDRSRLIGAVLPNVVYGSGNQTTSSQLNVDGLLEDPTISSYCEEKLNGVELAVLMFQTHKPEPTAGINYKLLPCLESFDHVTLDILDPALLDYYNEVRGQGFELKDYNKYTNSVSSSAYAAPRVSSRSPTAASFRDPSPDLGSTGSDWQSRANTKKYRLQTLDDFLGQN